MAVKLHLKSPKVGVTCKTDNAKANNHVAIRAGGGGTLDATNPAYIGRRIAVANLEGFEKGNTVTFTIPMRKHRAISVFGHFWFHLLVPVLLTLVEI